MNSSSPIREDNNGRRSGGDQQQQQQQQQRSPIIISSPTRRHYNPPAPSASAGQSALRQLATNRSTASVVNNNVMSSSSSSTSPLTTASLLRSSAPVPAAAAASALGGLAERLEATSLNNNHESLNFDLNRPPPRQQQQRPSSPLQQQQQQQRVYQFQQSHHHNTSTTTSTSSSFTPKKEGGWVTVPLSPKTSSPPCQRSLHAAAVVHDSLYVFGGYDGQHRVNDFYQYNFTTQCWREIVTLNSHLVGGTVIDNTSNVGGGGNNNINNGVRQDPPGVQQQQQQGLHRLHNNQQHNQHTTTTITATGTVPTPRDRHAAVVHNSTFYIFGGFDGTSRVADLYGFDVHRLVWRRIVPRRDNHHHGENEDGNAPNVVGGGGFNFINVHVDAGGGGGGNVPQLRHNLDGDGQQQQHNPNQNNNQQQRVGGGGVIHQYHDPPSPRHSHAAVVYKDCMYIFGGYDGSYRSDFHEFNFHESTWRPVFGSGRSPRARYRSTACVHDDTMILFGGHDGTRHLADVHTFDFENNSWGLLVIDGVAPLPRDSHVSVVYKDSVFVFGGSTGSAMNDLHELMLPPSKASLVDDDEAENGIGSLVMMPDLPAVGGDGPEDGGGPSSSLVTRTAKWRQIPQISGEGTAVHRFCHVGAVHNGSFYVFGGYDGSHRLKDFVKYDLAADDLLDTDIPPPSLLADLRSFLDDEDAMSLSDITLMVEGIPVRAHKLMLMRCPYFKAMLLGNMSESTQSVVHLEIVRHRIFLVVLEYLYTDEVDIPLDIAMELFVAADLFAIPRLQSMCERRLLESMTVENAATIFHTADVHSAVSLRGKALGYVLSHFEAVSKTDAFEDMARSNVELVFEILRSR